MTDEFKASCKPNEVIDIISAMYGRMHIGTCVTTDYGHLGCEADVRTMTDRRCSGRHECQIDIPDKDFERTRPCPVEFIKFFEVEYRCIKGIALLLGSTSCKVLLRVMIWKEYSRALVFFYIVQTH